MAEGVPEGLRLFISYRREDSIGIAGRIRDRLAQEFGADQVFFDVDTIPLGVDFRTHIDKMVAACDAVLVLTGRHWLDVKDGAGRRRLDQLDDFVRLEVEAALRRQIPVIPVLVDGAAVPSPESLPESLSELAFRNGIQVRYDPDFHADMDRLIRGLSRHDQTASSAVLRAATIASPPDSAPVGRGDRTPSAQPPAQSQPRPGRAILRGHSGPLFRGAVGGCAVAPDGSWIVSSSSDKTLRVWEVASGETRRVLTGHTKSVCGCAVAPDGSWIVSASDDHSLRVWDAASGGTHRILTAHTLPVRGCAVAPDGSWIVSASDDHSLRVWDAASGDTYRSLSGHTGSVCGCAVAPDGAWIVSASTDNTLRIWDVASGETRRVLAGHTAFVQGCAVAPDGAWIVSASTDNTLRIWDVVSGETRRVLAGHSASVQGCAVAPDGSWTVSASTDNTLRIWDVASGETRRVLSGHTRGVDACAVAPDGTWIVSAAGDKTLRVWDVASGQPISADG